MMLALDTFLKLLLLTMAAVGGLSSAESPACTCQPEGHLATCSFMDLTRVPDCLPGESVTQLYLDNNRISELTADQLRPFSLLRFLSAEANNISSLPDDLFQYTPRLREIYLGRNKITSLSPATFFPVENLQKLDLNRNIMTSVPPGTFRGLSKLLELDLSNNRLNMVQADAFPKSLRLLRLNENQLQSLPDKWPVSLEELDLSYNRLQRVDAAALQRLPALRVLRLERNPWHCTCDATGALAALVARRNFLEDMEDPMVCASPPELKDSQLLYVLRPCYIGHDTGSVSATPATVVHNSSVMPMTATNITGVPSNQAYSHAYDTLIVSLIVLVSICASAVAVLLSRKIYVICRQKRFCVKHDGEKLTSADDESVI